jgi:serine/threonine-protein kinase HipA
MSLPIYAADRLVGQIEADADGPWLQYEMAWSGGRDSFPISLTMPLGQPRHGPQVTVPWLMNLLPEGEPLRAVTRALGVAQEDILGLIANLGSDLAGALTTGEPRRGGAPALKPLPVNALERIIEELPARPFLVGEEGVSMSLAGAQEKLPLALVADGLAIPINGAASTHILKPDNPRLPGSVQNEALCMVLARRCGLSVAPVTTGRAGARSYLLVERYDRQVSDAGVQRLHQEDFCQALGKPPAAKYQHNHSSIRGPSTADMFRLVRDHMTAREINQLLDAVVFNIAIGNVDSHAKNYSVLLQPRRSVLAPLYDLMTGLTWPNITPNHAQDIGGQQRGRHIYGRHWRRMAQTAGLAGPATLRRVQQLAGRVAAEVAQAAAEVAAMQAGGQGVEAFAAAVAERALLVRAHAAQDDDQGADPAPEAAEGASAYDAT